MKGSLSYEKTIRLLSDETGGLLSRKTFWQFDYLAVGQQGDLIAKYLYWLVVRKSTLL